MVWNIDVPTDFTHLSAAGKILGWVFSKEKNGAVLAVRLSHKCQVFPGIIHLPRPDVHAIHHDAGPLAGFEIDYDFSELSSSTAPIKIEFLDQNSDWRVLTHRMVQFKRGSATNSLSLAPYIVRDPSSARANRPRILHAMANFMVGGSSRLVVDLIEHLGSEYQQSVLTSHAPNPPAYVGVDTTEIKRAAGSEAMVAHFKKVRPAFIHVHYWGDIDEPWYALVFVAAAQLGIPVVQNVNTPVTPFTSPSIYQNVYVSDTVRREFGGATDAPPEETIYPGSDFSRFNRPAGEEPPENCVGMVYRLEIDKLNADAIQPFIHCVMQRPATRVLIVGGGSLLEGFQSAVAKAGLNHAFEFTGYVPYQELPALYQRMSLFAAPVWKESFGQVSPFAMHMRVPVVGYDVGAIHEIIDDRSLLAQAGDAVALGNLMASLLDDRPRRLAIGMRNAARASEFFSLESMIARYRDLYARIPRLTP
jgi:glycosyltransferase involved in cell wall biosynthesis